ncbi:hypothetical protein [Burkholderia phage vB_BglM_WTB]
MARTKEQALWDGLKTAAVGRLLMHRIENTTRASMSDVIGTNHKGVSFWLELKALHEWPKRASTPALRGAFESGQLGFLREWRSWKGKGFVVLKVGSGHVAEWLLLSPAVALDKLTTAELRSLSFVSSKEDLIKFLENLDAA